MVRNVSKSISFYEINKNIIPEGSSTLAKSPNRLEKGYSPFYAEEAHGSHFVDIDGNDWLDCEMAMGTAVWGHNNPRINNAMLKQIQKGVNFSIPSTLEYELGCILLNRFPMYKAVKFFKNGGDSVYAAVRSSRFFSKKDKVLSCEYHGWHDWCSPSYYNCSPSQLGMDYIILLFSCIAEYLIFSDFFDAFLSIRPNFQPIWNRILIAIPFIGIYFVINTLQISYLNMISFICLLLLYSFLYEANFKERLLYIVFLCAIFFGCEFLFVVLLNLPAYLFHSSSVANLSTIPWQIFTLKLLTYLICCLYKQTSVKSAARMDRKIFACYLCIPIACIAMMLLTYYSGLDFASSPRMRILLCVFFAIMQFGNILIFRAFQKYTEQLNHNLQNSLIISDQSLRLNYYQKLLTMDEHLQELVHDTTHYMKAIRILLDDGHADKALALISELDTKLDTTILTRYSKNDILNAILTEKSELAQSQNIQMSIDVLPDITFAELPSADIISILSNLLDNAIEACLARDNSRVVQLTITKKNENNFYVIIVKNTYDKAPVLRDGQFVSTKTDTKLHGIGTKSIRHAVENNHGFVNYSIDGGFFVATVVLPIALNV